MKKDPSDSMDKLLRKREVAELLACSERTVEREVQDGRLTRVEVRGGIRFRTSQVKAIIDGEKS